MAATDTDLTAADVVWDLEPLLPEPGDDGPTLDATGDWREFPGNPAFLAGVERVIERRCRLLGLAAPEKVAVVAPVKLVGGIDMEKV